MSNINTMLTAVKESNPSAFHKAFQSEVNTRIGAAIQGRKQEVVSGMFGVSESEEEEAEVTESDEPVTEGDHLSAAKSAIKKAGKSVLKGAGKVLKKAAITVLAGGAG